MSDFKVIDGTLGTNQAFDATWAGTYPQERLGLRVQARDQASTDYGIGEFIYLKGVASTVVGSIVIYNTDDWTTALAPASGIGPVAVAMSACLVNQFGWYQIAGKAAGKVLAAFADNANCFLTGTAGSVDDTVVAGDRVMNMKGASAIDTPSTGLAELEIMYPFVSNLHAADVGA